MSLPRLPGGHQAEAYRAPRDPKTRLKLDDIPRTPRPSPAPGSLPYDLAILQLIPTAEHRAFVEVGQLRGYESPLAWAKKWNAAFHRHIDELARTHGIRCQSWQQDG